MIAAWQPGVTAPGSATVLAASTVRTVGTVIAVLALIGFAAYLVANFLSARAEAGSEIELAPNRKPYYDDEQLEGRKLTRTLFSGMALLAVLAVGLPMYWLAEPGRQEGAVDGYLDTFEARGLEQYEEGSQCANCHGAEGVGGQAPFTILDAGGNFVAQVNWRAPALNTVLLRFSREEVTSIIDLGRPGTPMPAWGEGGGGPRSEQEIDNIVDYLAEIQITSEESQQAVLVELALELGLLDDADDRDDNDSDDPADVEDAVARIDWESLETGEAAFNLGQESGFAGGAASCGRCHTPGWSIITDGEGAIQPPGADISDVVEFLPGSGAFGPPLDREVPRQFASVDALAEFITAGSVDGERYGNRGHGSGNMPGLGDNPNTVEVLGDGMLPREVICAIARYESTRLGSEPPLDEVPTTTSTTSTTTTTAPGAEAGEEQPAEAEPGFCDAEAIEAAAQAAQDPAASQEGEE